MKKSNDPDENIVEVSLLGNGVLSSVPDIAVSPVSYDYGDVQVGTSSAFAFVVTNEGDGDLILGALSLLGADSSQFRADSIAVPLTLASKDSLNVGVLFKPTSAGTKTARLVIESNDPDESTLAVLLTGSGKSDPVSVDNETQAVRDFTLSQNYPNPFNPITTITYSLPAATDVTLKLYNTLGQEVAVLVNEYKPAGEYTIDFDAQDLATGVYVYSLQAGARSQVKKLLLLR